MTTYGTIKANNITHSTKGTISTEKVIEGSAKCWVQYRQTDTAAVKSSLNVTSVTDDAAGVWTVAITNSFTDQFYCNSGTSDGGSTTQAVVCNAFNADYPSGSYRSSSTTRCGTRKISDNGLQDRTFNTMTYWGDLA